jgi:exopolyphosphatase / guanosine-5'-triphosphate,3'-diphosphate pyrophosphatase
MPRFAALDLGSNALRLRIVEANAAVPGREQLSLLPDGGGAANGWREIASLRASVRLGSEVFVTGKLAMSSIGQACAALREFRASMDDAKVDSYRATATSAVREASNGATLVERARREAGIELDVIEGIEEARLIQLAVVRQLGLADRRALLVDVGGGSTELTLLDKGRSTWATSLPIGTVRLLEMYLRGTKTVERARQKLLFEGVDRALAEAMPTLKKMPFDVMVGTGGSVDTLCELCPQKADTPVIRAPWTSER